MLETFIAATLGHFVGDYLLQSKKMALEKGRPNGFGICLFHCLIYTITICCFFAERLFTPIGFGLVFASHFFIDRYSLASYWLKLIKGRDIKEAVVNNDMVDLSFSCFVYAVADNTIHLVLLWAICKNLIV